MSLLERFLETRLKKHEEREYQKKRRYQLDEVIEQCREEKIGFEPVIVTEYPSFASNVSRFIEERAKRDLPPEQFSGNVNPKKLEHFVEIGGILIWDGGLHEISYTGPEVSRVEKKAVISYNPMVVVSERVLNEVYGGFAKHKFIESNVSIKIPRDLDLTGFVIEWHTHPLNGGIPSVKDADIRDSPLRAIISRSYYPIFDPRRCQLDWYQIKESKI